MDMFLKKREAFYSNFGLAPGPLSGQRNKHFPDT